MDAEGKRPIDPAVGGSSGGVVRHAYLADLLTTMWPEPSRLSRPARGAGRVAGAKDFVAVPNDLHPKLLLPRHPRRVTAAGLRNYKSSARGQARLKLQLMAVATRFGAADLLPSRVRIETDRGVPEAGIDGYLARALGRDLHVCVYIGPPRAVQKPVLQLLSPQGKTFGFAKVGTNDLTRRLVHSEGDALESLAAQPWTRLKVPAVLHRGQWNGHEVLVQEALTARRSDAPDSTALSGAMVELARCQGTTAEKLVDAPYWAQLHTRLAGLSSSAYRETLASALTRAESAATATLLGFGSWHGDWAPWNMSYSGSRVNLWDWEQFENGVPLGYDALHHQAQRDLVQGAQETHQAMESALRAAPNLLAPFGIEPPDADLVGLLYLAEIAVRYLEDGEVEAGTRMGRLHTWLEPVLAGQVERVERGMRGGPLEAGEPR